MTERDLYAYNPSYSSPEALKATFVARGDHLAGIVGELRAGVDAPSNRHVLITGPWGIGKTNLLLMVKYGVLDDPALCRSYVPIQTAEEEYSILSVRDLFARILELLVNATSDGRLAAAAKALHETDDDARAVEAAVAAVQGFGERTGRKVLLLVDNLDLILREQIRDEAQLSRLHGLLTDQSFLVVIGTARGHPRDVRSEQCAVYEAFTRIELDELSPADLTELLRRRAEWEGRRDLLARFHELQPRIERLRESFRGNPRFAMTIYALWAAGELGSTEAAVMGLLDDATPYCKARLDRLAPQARWVLHTFGRLGEPASPTDIAARTRLPVNQVNAILKRLRDDGYVIPAPQEPHKRKLYMVGDPVLRVWHQIRCRPSDERLRQFLEQTGVCDPVPAHDRTEEWIRHAGHALRQYRKALAAGQFVPAREILQRLEGLARTAPTHRLQVELDRRLAAIQLRNGKYVDPRDRLRQLQRVAERATDQAEEAGARYGMALCHLDLREMPRAIRALEEALRLNPRFPEAANLMGCLLADRARSKTGPDQRADLQQAFGWYRQAARARRTKHRALCNWGGSLLSLARTKEGKERRRLLEEALAKYRRALDTEPRFARALCGWGSVLTVRADAATGDRRKTLLNEAREKFAEAAEASPGFSEALCRWGHVLMALARAETGEERRTLLNQACAKFAEATESDPDDHYAYNNRGNALTLLARAEADPERAALLREACRMYEETLRIKPDQCETYYTWGGALTDLAGTESEGERGRTLKQACEKYNVAVALKKDFAKALNNWGAALTRWALTQTGDERTRRLRRACDKFRDALHRRRRFWQASNNVGVALANLAREQTGPQREGHLLEACANYRAALAIASDHPKVLCHWANALADLARINTGDDQERLFEQAADTYRRALARDPDLLAAANNLGVALADLAYAKTGLEQDRLLEQACEHFDRACQIDPASSMARFNATVAFLRHCLADMRDKNSGRAEAFFGQALDRAENAPQSARDLMLDPFKDFFRCAAREDTAAFAEELLGALRQPELARELDVHTPFKKAHEYRQKGRDTEVLDRLNPELRRVVEEIIQEPADEPARDGEEPNEAGH